VSRLFSAVPPFPVSRLVAPNRYQVQHQTTSGDRIIYLSVHYNRTVLATAVDVMCVVSVHVVCRTDRLTLLDTYQFNDSANEFEREPYCVKFSLHNTGEPAEGGRLQKLEGGLAEDYGVLKTEP